MRTSTRLVSAGAVAGLALLATASPATAHVSPDKTEVPVGAYTSVALTTGHGCEDSPTTSMAIQIPESIPNVTPAIVAGWDVRSAEHTSELQSLMRISYAVFCLKK